MKRLLILWPVLWRRWLISVGLRYPRFIYFEPILEVDEWDRTEEVPTGSREKITVIQPASGLYHIFKFPRDSREHQIWSELIASYIAGDLLGWEVQSTAIAQRAGRVGNLLRYVYEPEQMSAKQETFVEGWNFCVQVDPDFDVGKGTRHTLPLLLQVCDEVLIPQYGLDRQDFLDFWARALALDTLISNTDRHAENWAVVMGPDGTRMAGLYDNGSSLGCGLEKVGLDRAFGADGEVTSVHLDRQKRNGRHHLRTNSPSKSGGLFEEVSIEFLKIYPEGRHWFEAAGTFDKEMVRRLMDEISTKSSLEEPYILSERRKKHIYAMLQIGEERIKNILRTI